MSVKIIQKKENPLLSRTEISAEIYFEKATPSNNDVKKQLAAELKVEENRIAIKNIYTAFGFSSAKVKAYTYDSEDSLKKIEPKKKEKKQAAGVAAPTPAAEKK